MSASANSRHFVIGDIHGCIKTFKKLLEKIDLQPIDSLYILGDMIDRGPNSGKLIDYILNLQEGGYNIFPIMGNHEQMLITTINKYPGKVSDYLKYFGSADLLDNKGHVKIRYQEFFRTLPLYIKLDDFILVHASLDMTTENIFDNEEVMLFAKYHVGNPVNLKGKKMIHGHVVKDIKTIKSSIENNSMMISIDNGCVYYDKGKEFGKLVCLSLDTMEIVTKKYCG